MRADHGYSLLELLIALAIASILIAAAAPGMSDLAERTQQRNAVQGIVDAAERARSLAITTQRQVIVCPLIDASTCGENWSSGEIAVLRDANRNRRQDQGEELLFVQPRRMPEGRFELAWSNWLGDATITYRPDGSVASNGTLILRRTSSGSEDQEEGDGAIARLIISKGGRVRLETAN